MSGIWEAVRLSSVMGGTGRDHYLSFRMRQSLSIGLSSAPIMGASGSLRTNESFGRRFTSTCMSESLLIVKWNIIIAATVGDDGELPTQNAMRQWGHYVPTIRTYQGICNRECARAVWNGLFVLRIS